MKVAICMSGQLREWEFGAQNQKWFWSSFDSNDLEVDYFIHTWNYSQDRPGVSQPYTEREVSKEEYQKLIEFYAPKKSILDNKRISYFRGNDHWSSLFYSLGQSILLKQQYELENNFKYDLVVKTRPDVVFSPQYHAHIIHRIVDTQIVTTHGGMLKAEFNHINFNDCVFYSNSYTMDLLINLYFYRQEIMHPNKHISKNRAYIPIGPGVLMQNFFRDYGIIPYFSTRWIETLLKEGVPKVDLFDLNEFNKVEAYFRKWYTR